MQHEFSRNPTFCGDFYDWEGSMTRADARPRIHLHQSGPHWTYSLGPTAMRQGGGTSAGEQLDRALAGLDEGARRGVVVIVEGEGV